MPGPKVPCVRASRLVKRVDGIWVGGCNTRRGHREKFAPPVPDSLPLLYMFCKHCGCAISFSVSEIGFSACRESNQQMQRQARKSEKTRIFFQELIDEGASFDDPFDVKKWFNKVEFGMRPLLPEEMETFWNCFSQLKSSDLTMRKGLSPIKVELPEAPNE